MNDRMKKKAMGCVGRARDRLYAASDADEALAVFLSGEADDKNIRAKKSRPMYRWEAVMSRKYFRYGAFTFTDDGFDFVVPEDTTYDDIYRNEKKTVTFQLANGVNLGNFTRDPDFAVGPDEPRMIEIDTRRLIWDLDYANEVIQGSTLGAYTVSWLYRAANVDGFSEN